MQYPASLFLLIVLALRCNSVLASPVARGPQEEAPKGQTWEEALAEYIKDDIASDFRRLGADKSTGVLSHDAEVASTYATAMGSSAASEVIYATAATRLTDLVEGPYETPKAGAVESTGALATPSAGSVPTSPPSGQALSDATAFLAPATQPASMLPSPSSASADGSILSSSTSQSLPSAKPLSSSSFPSDNGMGMMRSQTGMGMPGQEPESPAEEPQYRTQVRRRRGNRLEKQH